MKLKHVLATLGLATTMALGVGIALNHRSDMKAAKAEDPTWMIRVRLVDDVDDAKRTAYEFSNYRFRCWGDGWSKEGQMAYVGNQFGYLNYYAVNMSFLAGQEVTGCQFVVTKSGADYYSNDIVFSATSASHYLENSWTMSVDSLVNAKWDVYNEVNNNTVTATFTDGISGTFVEDPANNVLRVDNWTIEQGASEKDISDRYLTFNATCLDYYLLDEMTDPDSKTLFSNSSSQWASFKEYGTYDLIICGSNGFSGLRIHKHGDAQSSYVYYVTGEAAATTNYAYTFGGTTQLGAWPGTQVTAIAGVQEVTGNGVVHFQGNNVRIYKIPLNIGGTADDQIIFHYYSEPKAQSANLYMKPGTALWWSAQYNYTNDQAGKALDLIVRLESLRNAVVAAGDIKAYSICGISKSNAVSLVNEYNALESDTKVTYVDSTKIHTYKGDGTNDEAMISVYDIMVQLSKIAEVSLSSNNSGKLMNNQNATIVVIISAIIVGGATGLFFIIRRRKHQ